MKWNRVFILSFVTVIACIMSACDDYIYKNMTVNEPIMHDVRSLNDMVLDVNKIANSFNSSYILGELQIEIYDIDLSKYIMTFYYSCVVGDNKSVIMELTYYSDEKRVSSGKLYYGSSKALIPYQNELEFSQIQISVTNCISDIKKDIEEKNNVKFYSIIGNLRSDVFEFQLIQKENNIDNDIKYIYKTS